MLKNFRLPDKWEVGFHLSTLLFAGWIIFILLIGIGEAISLQSELSQFRASMQSGGEAVEDAFNTMHQQHVWKTVRYWLALAMVSGLCMTAVNWIFIHLSNQRSTLEKMNQLLETQVAERTSALERSSATSIERANQIKTINELLTFTAGAKDMPSLIKRALEQALVVGQVEKGALWLQGLVEQIGFPNEVGKLFAETTLACGLGMEKQLIIHDWSVFLENHPLEALARLMIKHDVRSSFSHPILVNGKVAGYLHLTHSQPRGWRLEEVALIEIIARQLGIAAERTKYIEDIWKHNVQMRELVLQSELLNRPYSQTEVIKAIGQGALVLSKADRMAVFTRDRQGAAVCSWTYNLSEPFVTALLAYAKEAYPPGKATGSAPIRVTDLLALTEDDIYRQLGSIEGFRAFTAWPLTYEEQAYAFVCSFYDQPRQFEESEQEIHEAFFRQAAAAIENSRLFSAEQEQRQLAEALQDVTGAMTSTLDLDEVLDHLLNNLTQVVPHDSADIMLIKNGMLRIVRVAGVSKELERMLEQWNYPIDQLPHFAKMMETRQAVVIPSTNEEHTWTDFPNAERIHSIASAPICQQGKVIGFINLYSRQVNFFNNKTGPLLQTFAGQAAIAIQNAQIYQKTRQRMTDTLTLYRALQPLFLPTDNSQELSQQIAQTVTLEFASAHCSVLLFNEDHTHLVIVAQSGPLRLAEPVLDINGPGITVAAARTGQIIYSPDVTVNADYLPAADETRSELAIPLYGSGQVIGVLNLESPALDAFDKRAQVMLTSYAERAALALENAHLFAAVRRHMEEIKQLDQINRTALRMTDSAHMLRLLAEQVTRLLHANGCYITLWDEATRTTIPFAAFGPLQELYPGLRPNRGGLTLTFSALECNHPLLIENVYHSHYIDQEMAKNFPLQSYLVLPLIADDLRMGAMLVGFQGPHIFTPSEVALGEQAAGQIALAMAKNRSLEMAHRRAEEAENLRLATAALNTTLELRQLLTDTLQHLERVIQHDSAAIFLMEDAETLRVWSVKNVSDPDDVLDKCFPLNKNGLNAVIVQRLEPLSLEDAQCDPRFMGWGGTQGVRSWMGLPLTAGSNFLGILTLDRKQVMPFRKEEIELAQAFANQAAVAVRNAQLHSMVQRLAVTDSLTGVLNRRGFFDQAGAIVQQCFDQRQPISVIMLDIDFFKQVNDQYGHDAGDAALETVASRLKKSLRDSDLVCRYGGEEFAVLLAESSEEKALMIANRLHRTVTASPIQTAAGPVFVTVSIGVTTMSDTACSLEHMLKRADEALYMAKKNGRNQVCLYRP